MTRAVTAWGKLSGGLVDLQAFFADAPSGSLKIHRVQSTDAVVVDHELAQKQQPFTVVGWHDKTGTLYMVVDRIGPGRLHALLMHEMGHGIDLHWPWCPEGIEAELEGGEPCIHSPDPHAIMGPTWDNGADDFTPSDLAFCRASCRCR